MPVRDPNKIDAVEAIRLFNVWRDWHFVASLLKRPNGTLYKTEAIWKAVRRYDLRSQQ